MVVAIVVGTAVTRNAPSAGQNSTGEVSNRQSNSTLPISNTNQHQWKFLFSLRTEHGYHPMVAVVEITE
jgi:hypothetical protein